MRESPERSPAKRLPDPRPPPLVRREGTRSGGESPEAAYYL